MKTKEEILEDNNVPVNQLNRMLLADGPDKGSVGDRISNSMEEYATQKTEALNDLYQTSLAKYLEACTKIKALEERIRDLENRIIDYKERWLTKGT